MSARSHHFILYMFLLLCLVMVPEITHAQLNSDNFLNVIIDDYREKASLWKPVILEAAHNLFVLLLFIESLWMAIMLALRRADITEWAVEVVRHIMFIGFFYALLTRSGDWSSAIINSLMQLADQASRDAGGTGGVSPATIFEIGLDIAVPKWPRLELSYTRALSRRTGDPLGPSPSRRLLDTVKLSLDYYGSDWEAILTSTYASTRNSRVQALESLKWHHGLSLAYHLTPQLTNRRERTFTMRATPQTAASNAEPP